MKYVCLCTHTCVCTRVFVYMCVCTYIHTWVYVVCMYARMHVCVCVYAYTCYICLGRKGRKQPRLKYSVSCIQKIIKEASAESTQKFRNKNQKWFLILIPFMNWIPWTFSIFIFTYKISLFFIM